MQGNKAILKAKAEGARFMMLSLPGGGAYLHKGQGCWWLKSWSHALDHANSVVDMDFVCQVLV
jgi:hypothetical protein